MRIKEYCGRCGWRRARQARKECERVQRLLEEEYTAGNWGAAVDQQACVSL